MTRQIIRILDEYNFEDQFVDGCVIEVEWVRIDNIVYKCGNTWNDNMIISIFIHPESECAWLITKGYFEVVFDSYTEAGII